MYRSTARAIALLLSLSLGAVASPLVPPSPAAAQAPADAAAAQRFLEARHGEVHRLLRRPASEARNAQLSTLLDALLDYPELARRSLGRNWDARSEAERARFSELLEKLVARSYQQNLESTLSFEVDYLSAEASSDTVKIRTQAQDRRNRRAQPIEIDYSMHKVGSAWRVFDIHTDGVSLVQNYRSQFNRIIERDGFEGLIQKMTQRLEAGSN